MPNALKRLMPGRTVRRLAVMVLAIGTFFSLISPFGSTAHLPFIQAWAYWTGLVAWGSLVATQVVRRLQIWLRDWPRPALYLVISIVMAALVMPSILLVQVLLGQPIPLSGWPVLFGYVWIIATGITAIMVISERAFANDGTPGTPRFEVHIPARISGGTLYSVSAEDHYLRIRTSRGNALILMRLVDALRELDGYEGARTHRSWWVAKEAVAKVQKSKDKITLHLRDGTQAPVSRTYAPALRQSGWF